jgi:hypothetical protein
MASDRAGNECIPTAIAREPLLRHLPSRLLEIVLSTRWKRVVDGPRIGKRDASNPPAAAATMEEMTRRQIFAAGSRNTPARVQAAGACTQIQQQPRHKTVSDRAKSSNFRTRPPTTSAPAILVAPHQNSGSAGGCRTPGSPGGCRTARHLIREEQFHRAELGDRG